MYNGVSRLVGKVYETSFDIEGYFVQKSKGIHVLVITSQKGKCICKKRKDAKNYNE